MKEEILKDEAMRVESMKEKPLKEEPMKEEPRRDEPMKAEATKEEPVETELTKQEPLKAEPLKQEETIKVEKHISKAESSDEAKSILVEEPMKWEEPATKTESVVKEEPTNHEDPNYLIMVAMILSSNPTITRFLSVPPSLTFADFHQVLQVAFGWSDSHMHSFIVDVATRSDIGPCIGRLPFPKVVLQLQTQPQSVDVWPEPQDEANWRLCDVFEKKQWDGEDGKPVGTGPGEGQITLRYEYDMGDGWMHIITPLGRAQKNLHGDVGCRDMPVLCLGGEGHPCAEDSGGRCGWANLKRIHQKKRCNREDKEFKDWYKNDCSNGDPGGLDPYRWDILDVNTKLTEIFRGPD